MLSKGQDKGTAWEPQGPLETKGDIKIKEAKILSELSYIMGRTVRH